MGVRYIPEDSMGLFVTIIHIVACFLLVLVILLQSGKGAEISASFGGSSQTVFGSSGGANFFTRLTSILAAIFMTTSISLTIFAKDKAKSRFDNIPASALPKPTPTPSVEATPAPAETPVVQHKKAKKAAPTTN